MSGSRLKMICGEHANRTLQFGAVDGQFITGSDQIGVGLVELRLRAK
jgi:hypothetical protein